MVSACANDPASRAIVSSTRIVVVRQSRLATRVGSAADVALDLSGAGVAVAAGLLWLRRRREGTDEPGDG